MRKIGRAPFDGEPFDLVLLKVEPGSHPLYLVIEARRLGPEQATDEYFYNEHACPANWLSDVVAVVSCGDDDPHGFATFVARREPPKDYPSGATDYGAVFPEIDKGLA